MSKKLLTVREREVLRELGNQYAFVEFQADTDDATNVASAVARDKQATYAKRGTTLTPHQAAQLALFKDPYAFVDYQHGVDDSHSGESAGAHDGFQNQSAPKSSAAKKKTPISSTLTKIDFDRECRRIFQQYVPLIGNETLRPEHRSFISRNRVRSGPERYELLVNLRKYDLADLGGVRAQFNRERPELTEAKLIEIESESKKKKNGSA